MTYGAVFRNLISMAQEDINCLGSLVYHFRACHKLLL